MTRPPVESIELRFAPEGAAAMRSVWDAVEATGVHAMSRHDYNTPHVTLAAMAHTGGALATVGHAVVASTEESPGGSAVAAAHEEIAAIVAPLVDLELTASGPALFPHDTSVLYAAVIPRQQLLEVHAALHELLAARGLQPYPNSAPDRWTPHCTIAKRVRAAQMGDAIAAATSVEWPIVLRLEQVIHWDGHSRATTVLAPG